MSAESQVAIACSGLGHVRRGNEVWAQSVAEALGAAGEPVTLFTGRSLASQRPVVPVWNWPREAALTRRLFSWHHRYLAEQLTFVWFLAKRLRHRPEIKLVHVADPAVGLRLQRWSVRLGLRVVYKDGLLLGPPWCRNFRFVQALAPYYLEQARQAGLDLAGWRVIPHLVNTEVFRPAPDKEQQRAQVLKKILPPGAFVTLAVGDLSPGSSKRLDWIVQEFASVDGEGHLIVAGQASAEDRQRFETQARVRLGERLHLFTNISWPEMTAIYQCADVFAHAALREPFGIVFLEAMASGLPLLGHQYEVTRWIIGDAGETLDMSAPGALASRLRELQSNPGLRRAMGERARQRAVAEFSPARIVPLYQEMYRSVRAAP